MGTWTLLIYTVPSEPSRVRAAVWREVKKTGAVYLRDGVCALPEGPATTAAFRAIAERVRASSGQVTLVEGARLDEDRAVAVVAEANAARTTEYREIAREAERFLAHTAREREHRLLAEAELTVLEADLGKLRRWYEQVRARDHFGADGAEGAMALLASCDEALAEALDDVFRQAPEGQP
jgi:ChrB-like protein